MQAKLFTDKATAIQDKTCGVEGCYMQHYNWKYVDEQINEFLANNSVKILETHYSIASDPTNDGQVINSVLVYYVRVTRPGAAA